MTYREKIQSMIEQINQLYNDAEWLRDLATNEEKEYWNKHRGIFYDASQPLRKLDNMLSDNRAKMCLCTDTTKISRTVECTNCDYLNKFVQNICNDCKESFGSTYCNNCDKILLDENYKVLEL